MKLSEVRIAGDRSIYIQNKAWHVFFKSDLDSQSHAQNFVGLCSKIAEFSTFLWTKIFKIVQKRNKVVVVQ